ncbi:hypothetical protein EXIGLDRAFT_843555 [Exidia glandulosa HHB12029]|uniref:Zn(2)-C6 fungal-type domain-containing protein n=1 Tax=Exidia glandulosa HHB12029 TaxID=1314781 RepID=A0A165CJQ3_EXIGL|nr:hypothetical protein EXIGLDRAFT_843555 [Exidia glandulosa HHB12029]
MVLTRGNQVPSTKKIMSTFALLKNSQHQLGARHVPLGVRSWIHAVMSHSSRYTTDAFHSGHTKTEPNDHDSNVAESALRKRAKYSRSKTGCLTCRGKKVKCDESKPVCSRCAHGQRECVWPEGVSTTTRKRSSPRYPPFEGHSVGPSSLSSSSVPPSPREISPSNHFSGHGLSLHLSIPDVKPYSTLYDTREPHRSPLSTPLPRSEAYFSPSPASATSPRLAYPLSDVGYSPHHHVPTPSLLSTLESPFVPATVQSVRSGSLDNSLEASPEDTHFPERTFSAHSSQTSGHSPETSWNGHIVRPSPERFYIHPRERPLMQHFAAVSSSVLVASPPVDGTNPILALHMPLLSTNYAAASAAEAHKLALLSLASMHNAFLHNLSQLTSNASHAALAEAEDLRGRADKHLAAAMASANDALNDSTLAAAVTLVLTDILAGGHKDWDEHLAMAKNIIASRGGPALLAAGTLFSVPDESTGNSVVLCPGRVLLDYVVVFEVFGSLIAGEEPSLLTGINDAWWFPRDVVSTFHERSIETIFGFSRSLVPLIAKVFTHLLRASVSPESVTESMPPPTASDDAYRLWETAQGLIGDVMGWLPASQVSRRVANGNRAHQLALQILIMCEVFHVPHTDGRIQNWVGEAIASVQDCIMSKSGGGLLWPTLVVACSALPHVRQTLVEILDEFRSYCGFQVGRAEELITEVWNRLDCNHPRPHWRHVLEEFGFKVLLL